MITTLKEKSKRLRKCCLLVDTSCISVVLLLLLLLVLLLLLLILLLYYYYYYYYYHYYTDDQGEASSLAELVHFVRERGGQRTHQLLRMQVDSSFKSQSTCTNAVTSRPDFSQCRSSQTVETSPYLGTGGTNKTKSHMFTMCCSM